MQVLTPKQVLQEQKLSEYEVRKVVEKIYDGDMNTFQYIMRVHQFYINKENEFREHQVLLWFVKQGLVGRKFIEFFENEGSFLDGMNTAINRIEGRVLNKERIKVDEML